jgi:hypothetical protein
MCMKKSDRTLVATLVALAVAVIALVAINRLLYPRMEWDSTPRTPAEVLASLRDFDAIRVEGDFEVHVSEQPEFSVRYTPWHPVQGRFTARVEDRMLVLGGHGNRLPGHVSRVEVGLPSLRMLSAVGASSVEVHGMRAVPLTLRIASSPLVRLTENQVDLTISLAGVGTVQIDATSQKQANRFEIRGQTRIETLP